MRVVNNTHPLVQFPESQDLFRLNTREFVRRGLGLPKRLLATTREALYRRGRISVLDVLFSGLGDALPSGIYDNRPYGEWVHRALLQVGGTDHFQELSRHLHITATQLGNGKRAVFSASTPEVRISTAVAASSAIPVVYRPVRIGGYEYLDGGIRGTASLDLAIEHGAKLVVCINSLVPFDSREWATERGDLQREYISERGLEAVSAQTTRVLLHAGLKYHIKQLQRRHPDVDIILIEPKPDDSVMFFANIMRLADRIAIAEHGFRSVSVDLAGSYGLYKETLARYGIEISRGLVQADLEAIRRAHHDPAVVQRVLEQSSLQAGRARVGSGEINSLEQLERTLQVLDRHLEGRTP
jgi:predicted acylesterase/phospholipase RssA